MSQNGNCILEDAIAMSKIGEWLVSGDTGISSETIVAIALGATKGHLDAPYDPSDFGRCYRLIEKVPQLKFYFGKIGEYVPQFKGILENWNVLVDIYLYEKPSGTCPQLYQRIQSLRKD